MATWQHDSIQFLRLINECEAVLTRQQMGEIGRSMDLDQAELANLFERAGSTFDGIKALTPMDADDVLFFILETFVTEVRRIGDLVEAAEAIADEPAEDERDGG